MKMKKMLQRHIWMTTKRRVVRTEKGKKMVMMLMMRRSHEYLVLADEFVLLLLLLLFPSSTSLSPIFCEVWTTSVSSSRKRERASDGKTVLQMWAVCVVAIDSIIKRARVQSSKHDDDDATFQSRKNNARLVFLSPFRFFFFFILTNIQPRRTQRIKPNRRKSTLTFRLRSYCSFQTRNLGFVRSQRLVCRWIWTLTWTHRTPGSSSLLASL